MLYLSRVVGENKFAIVDTDDKTEEIVTRKKLHRIVEDLGIDIEGVETYVTDDGQRRVFRLCPCQLDKYFSRKQLKTRMLRGVDITVYRDEITHIKIDTANIRCGDRIDLSEFGSKLAHTVWFDQSYYDKKKFVVLVLKNGMNLSGITDSVGGSSCIRWDISQVTDDNEAALIYEELVDKQCHLHDGVLEHVIDNERRDKFWHAIILFLRRCDEPEQFIEFIKDIPDTTGIAKWLVERCRTDFWHVARYPIEFNNMNLNKFNRLINDTLGPNVDEFIKCKDYETLRTKYISVFDIVECTVSYNIGAIQRFKLFVQCFNSSITIQKLYIQLCQHVAKAMVAYLKAKR